MKFSGYSSEQHYRVAWRDSRGSKQASESMTLSEAKLLCEGMTENVECWLESWNGYEWEQVTP